MSPEETDECTETLNTEKTMVEVLLRKYGFGSWNRPQEVKCPVLIVTINHSQLFFQEELQKFAAFKIC